MIHRFGPFELDEDARLLALRGVPQEIQPLVFDLLAYLVGNAGRVIPKDELMDALWPDLTVTEASLQRAVSLARRALAAGGLERAIRSFVRHGYRFALDPDIATPEDAAAAATPDLAEARRLAAARDWAGAAERFERLSDHLAPEDVDLWALAVECRGRPTEAIPILAGAVSAHAADGAPARAARAAVTLAKIEFERSAAAVASGWLDRAESLLAEADDGAVGAYLLWMRSRFASFEGRAEDALALATEAHALAETFGDQGLRALTLTYRGFYNLALGRAGEGSAEQNLGAAIALSGGVDPITGSLVYCNILWACRTSADWDRARQWSQGFERWCAASFAEIPGACHLHRAEIIGGQGTLGEALALINEAIGKLGDEEAWSLGEGHRVRGDIWSMIGDRAAAAADYAAASALGWDAEPGNANLLFDEGEPEAALAALDRALSGLGWFQLQRRGYLLASEARIAALSGRIGLAADLLAEIDEQPERWPQPAIRALAAETRAALCGPSDPQSLQLLLLARQLWTAARMDFQVGQVRLELARHLLATGDARGAAAEIAAARLTAARIGSPRLAEAADAVEAAGSAKDQETIGAR